MTCSLQAHFLVSLSHRDSILNLALIGQAVLEKHMFENVDNERKKDHGYTKFYEPSDKES